MEPHYYSYEDYPFDTGAIAWPVSTSNEKAQGWFNRGLAWCCGFNHEEAIICFDSAVQEEDDFVMGHWALKAQKHLAKAKELVKGGKGNEMEQMLVNAMECRFPTPFTMDEEVRAKHDMEYKEAMKLLYEKFPDHPHIALLYVEALMQLSPWQLYDTVTCEPVESAREAVEILERMISVHKEHPGLLHLYMHLMEMSKDPGKALLALEPLRDGLVPASGHLYHVPSHIDVLLGRYHEAIIANKRALPSDRKIGEIRGSNNWYLLYRLHDFHFIVYSGMMLGNFELAMEAAEEIHRTVPKEALKIQARADWFEGFLTTKVHLLVRFGKWQQIADMPYPDEELTPFLCTITAYAKAVAYASMNQVDEARAAQTKFLNLYPKIPETVRMVNNFASTIMGVAEEVVQGEILYRIGEFEASYKHLLKAVTAYDELLYDEPWSWMLPPRHPLGAFYLEQGKVDDAIEIYRQDLKPARRGVGNPNNIWSLVGLRDALNRKGTEDIIGELESINEKIAKLQSRGDTKVKASCMCALQLVK